MNQTVSYCGLICRTCPIYLATREKDDDKRYDMKVEITREIMKLHGQEYKPEDITDCDGCKTKNGRLFSGCRNCHIRKCARRKGIKNCAYCEQYACEEIEQFFAAYPDARARLEAIRAGL